MKATSIGAALAAGALAGLGLAGAARADSTLGGYVSPYASPYSGTSAGAPGGGVVVVSCFRGPWQEVIWDHPEAVFLDSLRAVGYDYATAESIANRVCRDSGLVGNDAGLKAEMERIVAESPNFRQY